jgi:hypothetical protein
MVLTANIDFSLNSINQLIFVMVKFGVLFEVRTENLKYYLAAPFVMVWSPFLGLMTRFYVQFIIISDSSTRAL